jgi:hypothetical protein
MDGIPDAAEKESQALAEIVRKNAEATSSAFENSGSAYIKNIKKQESSHNFRFLLLYPFSIGPAINLKYTYEGMISQVIYKYTSFSTGKL